MKKVEIGRVERVPLRGVWAKEDRDFTTWLADNLDPLEDALGIDLLLLEREKRVGSFAVDLVAEDGDGNLVVIENQLERSDHDHLGKLVTYTATVDAKRAIWIVSDPRPEHLKAVEWLNDSGKAAFHLLKVEAVRIGDSLAAPIFTVITGPSEATSEAVRIKQDQRNSNHRYENFWLELLKVAKGKTELHQNISPSKVNWISTSAEMPEGFSLKYCLNRGKGRVELYIDVRGRGKEFNEAIFHSFENRKEAIVNTFGKDLTWDELPDCLACRICYWLTDKVNIEDPTTWEAFINEMIDSMISLKKALEPHFGTVIKEAEMQMEKLQKLNEVEE